MGGSSVRLTYCSNIHPGESWEETRDNIRLRATEVKERFRPDAPMGLGLRLSARAAEELAAIPCGTHALRDELDELGLYVSTMNGFPYGSFHHTRVKERVYRPDWRTRERLAYTERLLELLAVLAPSGCSASISTVPVGFRSELGLDDHGVRMAVENLLQCAASMWRVGERSGAEVVLALEPEPACYLETTEEAVDFVVDALFGRESVRRFMAITGLGSFRAEEVLRRHLGLCLDTCHAAVEFEQPGDSVRSIERAGVRLAKVQATAGLHVEGVDGAQREALRGFADSVYLHQVVARCRDADARVRLVRFDDLDQALASLARGEHHPQAWRVHYHVPVFERVLGQLTNTQEFLTEMLTEIAEGALCDQLEVETYTWSVLPEPYRALPVTDMIARELAWVQRALEACGRSVA